MNGSDLATFCEELNGGASIGETLLFQLLNASKALVEHERPCMVLSKWDGEAAMMVAYRASNAEGSRQFLTERIEWKADNEEVHAYPLPAGEGMEDGGFEIEIVLDEAPASNVFEFEIEGADELDFFYQPELTPEEIAEGAVRPNSVGSYAVYQKTKANHCVGDELRDWQGLSDLSAEGLCC